MKRAEIDKKYHWDLTPIFASDKDWQKEFDSFSADCKAVVKFKGKLHQKGQMLECLKLMSRLNARLYKIYGYSHLRNDSDGSDNDGAAMYSKSRSIVSSFYAAASFIESEISSLDEKIINEAIANKEYAEYDFYLKEIVRLKEHILSEKEEKIMALANKPLGGFQNAFAAFNSMDISMPKINVEGKKVQLTHGTVSLLLHSNDRNVRSAAFKGMYKPFKAMINTITALYGSSVASGNFYAQAKGFKGALEKALFVTGIPRGVYDNLVNSVNKNCSLLHDYMDVRRQFLKLDKLHMYDMHVSMFKDVDFALDYEAAYETVLKALEPMGADYTATLKKARDERWIDVMESEGKRNGAYMSDVYGVHPYVLLNHSKTAHDTFTIAHEMGHAMHSYYSSSVQPFPKHEYGIFLAEIASTVNEVLLLKHLLSTVGAKNKAMRAFLLSYYLDMFRTTLFRQTMFAEFEMLAHDMDAKGTPLTVKSLTDVYSKLNKKYYGKNVAQDAEIKYEWARIPHFYNAFYVYQYSTGVVSAVCIAKKILTEKGYVDTYKSKFLSAGGSDNAYEILKGVGVDLASPAPFEMAFEEFSSALNELRKEL